MITPGKELESVYDGVCKFGDAGWYIEIRTDEETWEDEIEYNAFLKIANVIAFCHFTDDDHNKFRKNQEVVDAIWRESSDVKDFTRACCYNLVPPCATVANMVQCAYEDHQKTIQKNRAAFAETARKLCC